MNETQIQELKMKLMPVIKKQKLQSVKLFGSRARGDNRSDSDYDLYIDAPYIEDMFELGTLFEELKRALKADVDIVLKPDIYTRLDDYMLKAIQRDGIAIYG